MEREANYQPHAHTPVHGEGLISKSFIIQQN